MARFFVLVAHRMHGAKKKREAMASLHRIGSWRLVMGWQLHQDDECQRRAGV